MIVVRIVGGLGNQMFQYAYAKALQLKGYQVKIDISKFKNYKLHGGYHLDKFKVDLEYYNVDSKILPKLNLRKPIKEKNLLYNDYFLNLPKNRYVKGYFQTEKYFKHIREVLLEQFVYKKELSTTTISYLKEIKTQKNSCSIHIRRGDYVTDEKANKVHGICDLKYYEKAIHLIMDMSNNVNFYIFSDDISWVEEHLKVENATYINHEVLPHEDMHLMSNCTHNITANSSFSWWGAWLNQHKDKIIISPQNWFVDKKNEVACEDWIKL